MQNSTARKLRQIPEGHLLVGIDAHKKKHAVVVMTTGAQVVAKLKVPNSVEGFAELCGRVERQVSGQGATGAMYGIEAGSHYWRPLAYFLEDRGVPLRLVSPFTLKRRREGEDLDRRKNDFRDAAMVAELLRTGKFLDTQLMHGVYADLRAAHGAYRRVQRQRTRTVNLLKALLDGLFPEFCVVFRDVSGKTAQAVLWACPIPGEMAALSAEALVKRVRQAAPGQRLMVKKLLALQVQACQSAGVRAGAQAVAAEVRDLVQQLWVFDSQSKQWEGRLETLLPSAPESAALHSIPGLGPITISGLLAELGPIHRFDHAKQLIKMAGSNPTEAESGGKRSAHSPISKKGRGDLRWCLWMAALVLLRHNREFATWAQALRERPIHPLKPREVLVAVGNRLLRLVFALVKHHTVYQATCQRVAAAA